MKIRTHKHITQVDVTANPSLAKRFEIKGFPTLLFFSKGRVYKYPGGKEWPRDTENLVKFAMVSDAFSHSRIVYYP